MPSVKTDLKKTSEPINFNKADFIKNINQLVSDGSYEDVLLLCFSAQKKYPATSFFLKKNIFACIKLKKYREAHSSCIRLFDGFLEQASIRDFEIFFENACHLTKKDSGVFFKDAERIFSVFERAGFFSIRVDICRANFLVMKRSYNMAVEKIDYHISKGVLLKRIDIQYYIKALFHLFEFERLNFFLQSDLALPLGEKNLNKEKKRSTLLLSLMDSEVLSESNDYRIVIFRSNNPKGVFVTFGTAAGHLDDDPFGLDFILSYGYDLIFVAQNNKTRYQNLSLDVFEKVVAPIIKFAQYKNIYTYGVSLGGYCAIYYSGCIDATAIAASPLNPWDSSLSNYVSQQIFMEKNLNYSYKMPYEQKHLRFYEVPKNSKQHFILYDSKIEMDRIFIESQILPVFKNSQVLTIDHGSHYLLTFLQKLKILKQFLVSIIEQQKFMDLSQIDFESSAIWNLQKGKWLLEEKMDYTTGIIYLKKSINLDPSKQAKKILEKYVNITE